MVCNIEIMMCGNSARKPLVIFVLNQVTRVKLRSLRNDFYTLFTSISIQMILSSEQVTLELSFEEVDKERQGIMFNVSLICFNRLLWGTEKCKMTYIKHGINKANVTSTKCNYLASSFFLKATYEFYKQQTTSTGQCKINYQHWE